MGYLRRMSPGMRAEAIIREARKRAVKELEVLERMETTESLIPLNYKPIFEEDEELKRTGYIRTTRLIELHSELVMLLPKSGYSPYLHSSVLEIIIGSWSCQSSSQGHMDKLIADAVRNGDIIHFRTTEFWLSTKIESVDNMGNQYKIVLSTNPLLLKDCIWPVKLDLDDLRLTRETSIDERTIEVIDNPKLQTLFNLELEEVINRLTNRIKRNPLRKRHELTIYRPNNNVRWESIDLVTFAVFIKNHVKGRGQHGMDITIDYIPETDWIVLTVDI